MKQISANYIIIIFRYHCGQSQRSCWYNSGYCWSESRRLGRWWHSLLLKSLQESIYLKMYFKLRTNKGYFHLIMSTDRLLSIVTLMRLLHLTCKLVLRNVIRTEFRPRWSDLDYGKLVWWAEYLIIWGITYSLLMWVTHGTLRSRCVAVCMKSFDAAQPRVQALPIHYLCRLNSTARTSGVV